jgi:ribose 5-phosphate isomerase A
MVGMNAKQLAAESAVQFVKNGMTVGLGTGSTSAFAIEAIGKRIQQGLTIKATASSLRSEQLAKAAGITVAPFSDLKSIDIYIDGADEVDKDLNLIKGGGGALLREKILAFNSNLFIVIVDEFKLVTHLGKFFLPVEVTPFAAELTTKQLQKLGCNTILRFTEREPYITDNKNFIIDCDFKKIEQVEKLQQLINSIPGVVENGLFLKNIVNKVIVGYQNGTVKAIESSNHSSS